MSELLQYIQKGTLTNQWKNNKAGYFEYNNQGFYFQFVEADKNCSEVMIPITDRTHENTPIVAKGFIAHLIKNIEKFNAQDIYSGYFDFLFHQHEKIEGKKPNSIKPNLLKDFVEKHLYEEREKVKFSEKINDFIRQVEQETIKEWVTCYFEYVTLKLPINTNLNVDPPKEHLHYKIGFKDQQRQELLTGLIKKGFILAETPQNHFDFVFDGKDYPTDFKPLKWIKTNSLTKGIRPNKKSLLDLLSLLSLPDNVIYNKKLINSCFEILNGTIFHNNNFQWEYSSILSADKDKRILITKSEYHKDLVEIVRISKEKE